MNKVINKNMDFNEFKNIFILIHRDLAAQSVPAIPAKEVESRIADHGISTSIPSETVELFRRCLEQYGDKFGHKGASTSQMMRVLFQYFLDNWETLPMEKQWAAEMNRNYVVSSGARMRNKMRLTLSGI